MIYALVRDGAARLRLGARAEFVSRKRRAITVGVAVAEVEATEDFLVAVDAADAVAFGRIISFALLSGLRRVNKHVPLLQRISIELDVNEAVVVVVGVIPAR